MKISLLIAACAACAESPPRVLSRAEPPAPAREQIVPTRYDEDRFYARPALAAGETLTLLLDTGGNQLLYADVVDRLHLSRQPRAEGDDRWEVVAFPELAPGVSMPLPPRREMMVLPRSDDALGDSDMSGMLGTAWFRDRCWRLDYPARALALLSECSAGASSEHEIELAFRDELRFPRIQVSVDAEPLDLLFDSGATTRLTLTALAALADGRAPMRATSFITHTRFETWRTHHPDWRILEAAEAGTGEAMIEVPHLDIAGHTIGPVWFTRRPDTNFQTSMAQWTDRPLDGALGGTALRHF